MTEGILHINEEGKGNKKGAHDKSGGITYDTAAFDFKLLTSAVGGT